MLQIPIFLSDFCSIYWFNEQHVDNFVVEHGIKLDDLETYISRQKANPQCLLAIELKSDEEIKFYNEVDIWIRRASEGKIRDKIGDYYFFFPPPLN